MADQRITQLTRLAQADVAANDVLAIVDVGSSVTKKLKRGTCSKLAPTWPMQAALILPSSIKTAPQS